MNAAPRFLPLICLHAAACAVLVLSGCATKKEIIVEPSKPEVVYDATPSSVLYGKASYYYGRWIGHITANGEYYKATDVTAAHKTLPFNTMVRVTNLKNGKSVIVRINNRGPYVKGRILDLSLVAAQTVDMTTAGVVPVKAEILRKIPVLPKPNRKLTEAEKRAAEKRVAQAAREAAKKKAETKSGLSRVFSFLRPAQ
jgi:rare lipoprotein A